MNTSVKTTKIEKKYKDKKTGQQKSITIDYAKVVDRLNAFRSDNPRSKIATKHMTLSDGRLEFKAYIWKDKADFMEILKSGVEEKIALLSADSDGTAEAPAVQSKNEKNFEKLETIAVGRALALLGYAASGEIASSEEMEAFEEYKKEKAEKARQTALDSLEGAKTIEELKAVFSALPRDLWQDDEIIARKDEMKKKLSEESVEKVEEKTKEGEVNENSQN